LARVDGSPYRLGHAADAARIMSDSDDDFTAEEVAMNLGLSVHPEGGYARQMQGQDPETQRVSCYRLLTADMEHPWSPMDIEELWTCYMGSPLMLEIATGGPVHQQVSLAGDGQWLSAPPGAWVRVVPQGAWTLAARIGKQDPLVH